MSEQERPELVEGYHWLDASVHMGVEQLDLAINPADMILATLAGLELRVLGKCKELGEDYDIAMPPRFKLTYMVAVKAKDSP